MPEGLRLGEICELLHATPNELEERLTILDRLFLNEYLNEKARRMKTAFGT
jgi:hypothetical protein